MHIELGESREARVGLPSLRVNIRKSRPKGRTDDRGVSFWQQLHPYLPDLYAYLGRQSLQHCDKEDILQETLLRIWARGQGEEIAHPKSYLVQVARSVLIDRTRRATVRQGKSHCALEPWHEPIDPLDPDRIVLAKQELILLTNGMNKLPQRTRDIFMRVRVEGNCIKAIAEDFGISVSAVEKHLARAISSLAKHIRDEDYENVGHLRVHAS